MGEPIYTFENGLRKVAPYFNNFTTRIKSRWLGKTLVELQTEEFGQDATVVQGEIIKSQLYIETNQGRKKGTQEVIKGWEVLGIHPLSSYDLIINHQHRHEPSVTHREFTQSMAERYRCPSQWKTTIPIVFESEDLLVISKPTGIPTHPTGNYHYNSITEILKFDLKVENIWPAHRLDKSTLGILILGRNGVAGKYYQLLLANKRMVTKKYYARVAGKFPENSVLVNCPIFSVISTSGFIRPDNAKEVPADSTTIFTRVSYNSTLNQSVVICQPITGRTHQIRIHLRNIGFPIVNDFLYNPVNEGFVNQPVNKYRNELDRELYGRVFSKFPQYGKLQSPEYLNEALTQPPVDLHEVLRWYTDETIHEKVNHLVKLRKQSFETLKNRFDTTCQVCDRQLLDTDRDLSDQEIYLHAFKYTYRGDKDGESFEFEDYPPEWGDI